jgi:putative sugar O-methyltransferase
MESNNNLLKWSKYTELCKLFGEISDYKIITKKYASSFWLNTLEKRHNFPSFNEMITFRRQMATGIGYNEIIDEENEKQIFRLNLKRAKAACSTEFLKEYQESSVGNPYQYFWNGILSSSAGLNNCTHAWRILSFLKKYSVKDINCILEIGAGYGGVADLLIRALSPTVVVICDLPENLFLSFFYLSVNHPQYDVRIVHDENPKPLNGKTLIFCTPQGIELIKRKYELVVNTHSFQEMNLDEIHRYFDYIFNNMKDDSLFYFLNHFGAAGAQKPCDYPLDRFKIESWGPFPVPQPRFFHRKQAIETLLIKSKEHGWPPHFQDISENIALLLFAGVNENVVPVCNRIVKNMLSPLEVTYLKFLNNVLFCRSPDQGLKLLSTIEVPKEFFAINTYLSGILCLFIKNLVRSEEFFKESIKNGLAGFAKARACVALGIIAKLQKKQKEAEIHFNSANDGSPQFEADLEDWNKRITIDVFNASYKFVFPNISIEDGCLQKNILSSKLKSIKYFVSRKVI